jgi:menaquinone-9 beta-reductase
MSARYDTIIVGAGVAGSTAAILLARAGWSVALVEKHEFPRRKVCGEALSAGNLALLDELGIGSDFADLAGPSLRRTAIFAGDEALIASLPRFDDPRHAWGRALGREHLDTLLALRASALGADIWQPWTLMSVSSDEHGHLCELSSRSSRAFATLFAPIVIEANGSWESDPFVRERRRSPSRPSDLFAFKANFEGADLAADLLPLLAFPGGYGGMVTAGQGILTLSCCIRRDELRECRVQARDASAGEAVQAHLEAHCAGARRALRDARRAGNWLAVGPIRPGIRPASRGEGRFAIGNAAGEAHPIVAEGISMAIQSAWLLCERLIAQGDRARASHAQRAIARDYAAAWRRSFTTRIRAAALFAHLAMRPHAARVLLPLLRRHPSIVTVGARLSGKVRRSVDLGRTQRLLSGALK